VNRAFTTPGLTEKSGGKILPSKLRLEEEEGVREFVTRVTKGGGGGAPILVSSF